MLRGNLDFFDCSPYHVSLRVTRTENCSPVHSKTSLCLPLRMIEEVDITEQEDGQVDVRILTAHGDVSLTGSATLLNRLASELETRIAQRQGNKK